MSTVMVERSFPEPVDFRDIQAIEDASAPFWLGVQFHPEFLIYRAPFRRLFKALVEAAAVRAEERRQEHVARLEREAAELDAGAPARSSAPA